MNIDNKFISGFGQSYLKKKKEYNSEFKHDVYGNGKRQKLTLILLTLLLILKSNQ